MELNEKQKLFCLEYLKDFNATRAYKTVYKVDDDKVASASWSRMLGNVNIQNYLRGQTEDIANKLWLSVERVLQNLKELAERCMQKRPVLTKKWEQVTEYVEDEDWEEVKANVRKFDSAGANSALEKIGKYFQMFTDKVQLDGNLTIETIDFSNAESDDED